MNAILQDRTFVSSCAHTEGHRASRGAHDWAALAVAGLNWAALAVGASAFVAAGAAVWFGWE